MCALNCVKGAELFRGLGIRPPEWCSFSTYSTPKLYAWFCNCLNRQIAVLADALRFGSSTVTAVGYDTMFPQTPSDITKS